MFLTSILLVCLTEWTKAEDLSSDCLQALPVKEDARPEKELSAEAKRKADARRRYQLLLNRIRR